ncbi:hypothetical protein [Aurantiacibacter spongiae]|uniref:Uncharacterized protein n=1 Tax=Aurantiacibacter spongiae TaxID=2488860 RepID=A0A3N5DLJ1_9SPHN|nr:hypothetical protein [Aurantiacibacter spongiae]RPF71655.1 hypothetical protein EG799_08500 [Aurantiacibacter spongiae]
MKKILVPAMLAGSMLLSGCAAGYGGNPLGGLLGGVFGGNTRNSGSQFERAAVEACGREASRYGRVQIADVRQSRDIVEVYGSVEERNRYSRQFRCAFRSDGRIVDFQVS